MPGIRADRAGGAGPDRLALLDGLRGLSALYVVMHHAALEVGAGSICRAGGLVRGFLRHGHFAVAVFIVLSGYCLMRPVARDPSGQLRGGVLGYLGRRARRILPPYYAALGLCWLLIAVVPVLGRPGRVRWDRALPAFEPAVVASHLLLVHNLDERWIFKVDPPLWSVATEWQIYLVFPALLAVWRRHGIAAAVAVGFAAGNGVAALAGLVDNSALAKLCPWYAGLFALGMAGAVDRTSLVRSNIARPRSRSVATAFGVIALVLAALAVRGGADATVLIADGLIGASATALIVGCARSATSGSATTRHGCLRFVESRPAVALGTVSYSLYLTHFPLLAWLGSGLRRWGCGPDARLSMMLLAGTPLCLLAAFTFHLAFERRSLPRHGRKGVSLAHAEGLGLESSFRPHERPRAARVHHGS